MRSQHYVYAFTLFEVLAAVALLAILYTTLARVAIEGLRAEGESARRLEASLLADRILSDLELQIDTGGSPELGVSEREEGDFFVTVEVRPFTLPQIPLRAGTPEPQGILSPKTGGVANGPLREIALMVRWLEGPFERRVVRTSYAFDYSQISEELEALAGLETARAGAAQIANRTAGSASGPAPEPSAGSARPPEYQDYATASGGAAEPFEPETQLSRREVRQEQRRLRDARDDTDGDGVVSREERREANQARREARQLLREEADFDQNGTLDAEERAWFREARKEIF